MAAKDGSMKDDKVTLRAIVLLLLLLRFLSLPNKRLGGPGNTKVRGFHCCANTLNSQ